MTLNLVLVIFSFVSCVSVGEGEGRMLGEIRMRRRDEMKRKEWRGEMRSGGGGGGGDGVEVSDLLVASVRALEDFYAKKGRSERRLPTPQHQVIRHVY